MDVDPSQVHHCMYSLTMGVIPCELAETFPLSQHQDSGLRSQESEDHLADRILEFVKKNFDHYEDIVILQDDSTFTPRFYAGIARGLKRIGLKAE